MLLQKHNFNMKTNYRACSILLRSKSVTTLAPLTMSEMVSVIEDTLCNYGVMQLEPQMFVVEGSSLYYSYANSEGPQSVCVGWISHDGKHHYFLSTSITMTKRSE